MQSEHKGHDVQSTSSFLPLHHTPSHSLSSEPDAVDAFSQVEHDKETGSLRSSRVSLTGYRLLNLGLIIGIGTAKAILVAQGHSVAPSVLEWVLGVVCAAGRLYWVGLWESVHPPVMYWFLHEDYTPEILFLAHFPISVFIVAVKGVFLPVGSLLLTVVPLWLIFNPLAHVSTNWALLRFFSVVFISMAISVTHWLYTDDCPLVSLGRVALSLPERVGFRVSPRFKQPMFRAAGLALPTSTTPFSATLFLDLLAIVVVGISAVAVLDTAMFHWSSFGMMELCAGSALTFSTLFTLSDDRRTATRLGDWFMVLVVLSHGMFLIFYPTRGTSNSDISAYFP
ncbi:hypothetical protein EIP91_007613 [Steccherinum ochraceum]|uniref:Uncharacterized protein n=1 Tax=Steccherinum ochraceum TaxID=92696 RepID=A0A4R0RED0_9APHY|nr:hypothetical protein EIP91_007613 [Steccherinum ochraceum]